MQFGIHDPLIRESWAPTALGGLQPLSVCTPLALNVNEKATKSGVQLLCCYASILFHYHVTI